MNFAAANATPMIAIGVVQLLCGVAIFLAEVLSLSLYEYSGTVYSGIVLGIFYIITGSIGTAAGSSARNPAGSGRCLAIASLVMSILSILNAFSMIIWCSVFLDIAWYLDSYFFIIRYYGVRVVGTQLAFFIIVFIASIVMCVFSTRAMKAMRSNTMTTVTHVTHLVPQQGMVYNVAQYPGQQFAAYSAQQPYGQPPATAYAYSGQQFFAPPASHNV
ncbi:uncharacterized protein LOC129599311 [Paramacrobiotus metropolitanus]|uniref:uncharacterized protein LOC129599311 n=1 Tax=Paramacrobiotus metropolitanus TaxID=2943436 RepID=UPI002445E32C|nr:uncharacterized protein LOC129599311 [Paramacrobiotus metropolitanus]